MDLTDEQWERVEPLIPKAKSRPGERGRAAHPARDVLEAILWVLRTGAPWHDLPDRYPSYQTCHRRFQPWIARGTLRKILTVLYDDLRTRGGVNEVEAYVDGTYAPAKKGGSSSADAGPARRQRSWRLQTALVFLSPLASQMVRDTTSRSSTKSLTTRGSRRYRRRWKVERLFAWLKQFRRVVARWERKSQNDLGIVHLACIVILLRPF